MTGLDRISPIPLYHQIFLVLREEIESGASAVGTRLESEAAMCRRFGVSRATARQAVQRLADHGYVSRRRGRGAVVTTRGSGDRSTSAM